MKLDKAVSIQDYFCTTEIMRDHILMIEQFNDMRDSRESRKKKEWESKREEREAKKRMFHKPP